MGGVPRAKNAVAANQKSPIHFSFFFPRSKDYHGGMKKFTAIIHQGEPAEGGFWATCLEVPGANGQGETKAECLGNLKEAIKLLLETEREEVFRLDPCAETEELVLA